MIFFPVVNEACRVFAEGIAVKAADLDIASVMGMGFPPYRYEFYWFVSFFGKTVHFCFNKWILIWIRGGIMFWADSLGSKYIYSRLEGWSKTYGEFFKPCAFLAERAARGAPLVRESEIVVYLSSNWNDKQTNYYDPSENYLSCCLHLQGIGLSRRLELTSRNLCPRIVYASERVLIWVRASMIQEASDPFRGALHARWNTI